MAYTVQIILLTALILALAAPARAFGAGDIPDFSYLNGRAFRHGDIENVLQNVAKVVGMAGSGGLLSLAKSFVEGSVGGGKTFSSSDVKHVYFGNWLRDYSQAMDIAGLSKLSAPTLVMVVAILGFMEFGFATDEYEVTPERLGVYLPVEHIDNPKGYAEKEGDARQFHPRLRPPVDPEELEIDPRTGMKKYMATDGYRWDTSTAHIRRTLRACILHGQRARGQECPDLWEAYRLLGTGLHTLEDLLAHSNWCEIGLRKLGYQEVFCHVGDRVLINTPNGPAPPLVTGTFGSADFMHSLMGEATDHLSAASVVNLSKKMDDASNSDDSSVDWIRKILTKIPGIGGDEKAQEAEDMKAKAYHFNPDNYASEDVQRQFMSIVRWRDDLYRDITEKIEMIPGLEGLIDELTNALNTYVYSVLAPWLGPIIQQTCGVLGEGSKAIVDTDDQYEVFNNPRASDPSHSLLSKDHFALILNEPAGKIAQIVVQHTVNLVVNAWFDDRRNPDQTIDMILEAFHHPYYADGRSRIQEEMLQGLQQWIQGLDGEEAENIIQALTKESVRNGNNKRADGSDEEPPSNPQYGSFGQIPQRDESYEERQNEERPQRSYNNEERNYQDNRYGNQYAGREEVYESRRDDDRFRGGQEEPPRQHRSESYREESYRNEDDYRDSREYTREREQTFGEGEERSPPRQYRSESYREESHRNEDDYRDSREYTREREQTYGEGGGRSVYRNQPESESGYGNRGYQPSYDAPREGSRYQDDSGYQPEYGDRRREFSDNNYEEAGESQETFGAERLNLGEHEEVEEAYEEERREYY